MAEQQPKEGRFIREDTSEDFPGKKIRISQTGVLGDVDVYEYAVHSEDGERERTLVCVYQWRNPTRSLFVGYPNGRDYRESSSEGYTVEELKRDLHLLNIVPALAKLKNNPLPTS